MNEKTPRTFSLAYAFVIGMAITNLSNIPMLLACVITAVGIFLSENKMYIGRILLAVGALAVTYFQLNIAALSYYSKTMIDSGVAFGVIFLALTVGSLVVLLITLIVGGIQKEPKPKNKLYVFADIIFAVGLVFEVICVMASKGYFLPAAIVVNHFLTFGILDQSGKLLSESRGYSKGGLVKTVVLTVIVILITFAAPSFLGGGGTSGPGSGSSSNRCTICGSKATNKFQGSGYCEEHYTNAVLWAFENVAGKD